MCDGFHGGILAHGNGRMGLRHHQRFVCCRGVASTAIPVAVGGWDSGGIVGRYVPCDIDEGLLRNGAGQSGTGCCGGSKKGGGRER